MNARQALKHWGLIGQIRPIRVGIFNETYRAQTASGNFILQKLHPLISHDSPTYNYALVTNFLRKNGYPAQEIICTPKQNLLLKDGKRSWRLLREIPGTVHVKVRDNKTAHQLGRALGRVHIILKKYKEPMRKTLPMFQYDDHLQKLRGYKIQFEKDSNPEVHRIAQVLLAHFPEYFLPANLPRRMVHTDPKISNFISHASLKEAVMIDFDTVQRLSPLYDIGDALRSICGSKEDGRQNNFDTDRYQAFLGGYFSSSGNYLSSREKKLIPQSTALVILGLAARFLNDYIDDFYFDWEPKRYTSRKAHNLARAIGQVKLYEDFAKKHASRLHN